MTVEELQSRIETGQAPVVLDVRSLLEYTSGHIPGAVHAPLTTLVKAAEVSSQDKNSQVVLTCEHGPRAQLARMLLKWAGYKNIALLQGHMNCWRRSGFKTINGS